MRFKSLVNFLFLCTLGFCHIAGSEGKSSSSKLKCVKDVKFYDDVAFTWHNCSICSEAGGSQFPWQCEKCCRNEITTPGPNSTSEPGTLSVIPKNFSELNRSPSAISLSTTLAPSVPTTSKGLTNVEIGLTVTVCVVAAVAFTLIIILIILKKTKRIGRSSPHRVPADEDETINAMEHEGNQPIPCTDKETTNPFTSITSV